MLFWRKKKDEFEVMDEIIQDKPGITPTELARELRSHPSTITRRLPSLDEAGYLYYEDEKGGLWPFNKWF